ncbi:MAG: TetR/AcrR family transcriptional regulator [Acidobacteria bacterium]|nr:TetR/AcrR family transcriptional regulator [Acidobacteriota bacterium]MBI3654929.1 TetR/AcrR family transcriptional regulator [Acidobacteriota bacterium]
MTPLASPRKEKKSENGKPARRKSDFKYQAILRAGIDVFARNGFFNAKVSDIAKEAGVADGTVYLYFKNKSDILISIFNHTMDTAIHNGRVDLEHIRDPVEKLRQVARRHLEMLGRDRNLAIVFQVELRQSTKFMETFSVTKLSDYLDIIRHIIEEGQGKGEFRKEIPTKLVAKVFFGALDEMVTNWILSPKKYHLASTANAVIDIIFNGLLNNQGGKHS